MSNLNLLTDQFRDLMAAYCTHADRFHIIMDTRMSCVRRAAEFLAASSEVYRQYGLESDADMMKKDALDAYDTIADLLETVKSLSEDVVHLIEHHRDYAKAIADELEKEE